jgi:hypothetical protein
MANIKISALPLASTPLAGTEVLPIVQGGITEQVSVANLTVGRAISATAITASTGNFIVGTAGQGVDFSADPAASGMTSELLDDYEEGTWTPVLTSGSGTITTVGTCTGQYTKIGRQVTLSMDLRITTNGTAAGFIIVSGVPINIGTTLYGAGCGTEIGVTGKMLQINPATTTTINITNYDGTYPGASGFRGCLVWTYFV